MPTPAVYRPGYEFDGWDSEVPENVPAEDKTYRAKWKPLDGIAYSVKYYIQNPDEKAMKWVKSRPSPERQQKK